MGNSRAIVMGASVAGLLAARALTEAYSDVVIVDRDGLADEVTSAPCATRSSDATRPDRRRRAVE